MVDDTRSHVLLTGASGRVGCMVRRHWPARAPDIALTPQYRRDAPPGALDWDPLDGPGALLASGARIDTVIALAGVTPAPGRDLSRNRHIAEATLAAAWRAGTRRVLLASSSAVYGPGDGHPLGEDAPCTPANAYGRAKREMEVACAPWRARGLETCCLRIGNVAGADALLVNVAQGGPGEPVVIDRFADGGGPVRSYIGPGTLAAVLATLCRAPGPLPRVLNIAAPAPVAMTALAEAAGAPYAMRPAPPGAHPRITLDCTRLADLHNFKPEDSTASAMVRQWEWARAG